MSVDWKKLVISLAVPLAGGALIGWATSGSMEAFEALNQPALSPPGILFPIVWAVLYLLMGVSCYLIWTKSADPVVRKNALAIYALQLLLNFAWPLIFFVGEYFLAAFFCLLALWLIVLGMILRFYKISPLAAYLQIPYIVWLTFAGYLNIMIYALNK